MPETKLKAYDVAYYLDTAETGASSQSFNLVGTGVTTITKTLNPQTETSQYINERTARTDLESYQPSYGWEAQAIVSDAVVKFIYDIAREEKLGDDIIRDLVVVELTDGTSPSYTAYKRSVVINVSDISQDAGKVLVNSGSFDANGDQVAGTFNVSTKAFTAA